MTFPQVTLTQAWKTSDGVVHADKAEAEERQRVLNVWSVLDSLDVYWRETRIEQVAKELIKSGWTLLHLDSGERA